ncbi:MAG: hypothetical protein RLZZ69_3858 [Cyanobacteriota bacterium]
MVKQTRTRGNPVTHTITIRNKKYQVAEFSDLHLLTLDSFLQDPGDLIKQSEVGFVISEIIIPDIDSTLIRQSKSKYILLINASEIAIAIVELHKIFWQRALEVAIADGDKEAEDNAKAMLENFDSAD